MRKRNFFGFLLLIFSQNILAITEQEFIKTVLSQDTHFEKDQIYVNIKQLELDASRDSYAGWNPVLAAAISNSHYDLDRESNSNRLYVKKNMRNSQAVKLAVVKRFLTNPSTLAISAGRSMPDEHIERYKQTEFNDAYSLSEFNNSYLIYYKYPLLKHDSKPAKAFKTYKRNILDLEREELDFYDAQESFLVDRLEQYFLWNLYYQRNDIYQKYVKELTAVKTVKEEDKKSLKTAILLAEQDILKNNSLLQAQQKMLSVLLNDSNLTQQIPQINRHKNPDIVKQNLSKYLPKNVRILRKYLIDKKLKTLDLEFLKNQSLVKLDFNIGVAQNINIGNTLTIEYKNDSVNYFTGLTFSMPIGGNVNNKKGLKVARLDLQKLGIDYNNKLRNIRSNVEALSTAMELDKKTLSSYGGAIESLTDDVELMSDDYFDELANIKDLIGIYEDKRNTELAYADSVIGYQQNILKYNDELDRVLPIN
ncbi:MAG: TolC family protein [Candidatus Thioglobus sp.]|nr:TolC family protein [Candidatus Thioglobus sp.]